MAVCAMQAFMTSSGFPEDRGNRPTAAKDKPGLAYPPQTVGLTRLPIPKTPRPKYLVPTVDPTFRTRVIRITAPLTDTLGSQAERKKKTLRHHYSKDQPWNCDGALIKIARYYLLDAKTYHVAGTYSRPSAETLWSYKDPRLMWTFDSRGKSFQTIRIHRDEKTGKLTGTRRTLRKFTGFDEMYMGRYEGNLSWDDRYVAFMARKGDDLWVVVYEIPSDKIVASKAFKGKWPAGKEPKADWCSMSPSGMSVLVLWEDDGSGRYCGVEVLDRDLEFQRQLTVRGEHGDLGYDPAGNEVWAQVCCGNRSPAFNTKRLYDAALVAFRLRDGRLIRVLDRSVTFGGHVSCRNFRRPGWAYVTAVGRSYEAFAVKLDGSQTVQRFAHTHALRTSYSAEAHGVPNPDGTRFMFASNWDGDKDASVYSYVAEYTGEAIGGHQPR